jgi:very-short-patch-repair endonuclease
MAKYDYPRLKSFCDGKNITLIKDYSKERINAHTKIEFNCVELDCVSTHIKNMESFITGAGAYCRKHELQHRAVMQRTNIRKIPFKKSIAYTHPEIAKQWHPIKNEELKPEQFSFGSEKEFWWICPKQTDCGCVHEYEMMICNKIKSDCSFCCIPRKKHCIHESILYTHSKLLEQWHPIKNGDLKPEHFTRGSHEEIWWLCNKINCNEGCLHEWQAQIKTRVSGYGCPFCSLPALQNCKHNSFAYKFPNIANELHPTKNVDININQISICSGQKFWWICMKQTKCGCIHEWETTIAARTYGSSCPFCLHQKICVHESITYTHPEIAKEWHPTKNPDLTPEMFSSGSGRTKIWWQSLECKHEWSSIVVSRTKNTTGCPFCVNKTEKKLFDSLSQHYSELLRDLTFEWCKNIKHLRFDSGLLEHKIIIEIDGIHHFEDVPYHNSIFVKRHEVDVYKMKCANENGYSVIRLLQTDVFYDTYDWLMELRKNIEKIILEQRVQNLYMCKDNEYAIFTT